LEQSADAGRVKGKRHARRVGRPLIELLAVAPVSVGGIFFALVAEPTRDLAR
jgi:hypothetical protein